MDSVAEKAPETKKIDCKLEFEALKSPIVPRVHTFPLKNEISGSLLTVGHPFKLICTGEGIRVPSAEFRLRFDEALAKPLQKYAFVEPKLVESSPDQIVIETKSYLAGKRQLKFFIEGDASGQVLEAASFELNVISVRSFLPKGGYFDENAPQPIPEEGQGLTGATQQGKPQPFPMLGNIEMPYPIYLWIALAVVILLFSLTAFAVYRTKKRKKELMSRWEECKSPVGSHKDFHKTLRSKERVWYQKDVDNQQMILKIYEELRLFFFREYQLDNQKKDHKHILEFFAKNKKSSSSRLNRLRILLDDLSDASADQVEKEEDVKDYLKRSRELVDHLYLKGGV